jgi:nudix-type nucleoside diphosphatase (YffH/AdpP family)
MKIISKKLVFNGHFNVIKYTIGENDSTYERDICESKDAVFVLPFDPVTKKIVLIKEKRFGLLKHTSDIETWSSIAGTVDKDLPLESIVGLELMEEAGIDISQGELTKLYMHYSSPGIVSERKHIYLFKFDSTSFDEGTFGVDNENEVTVAKLFSYSDAMEMSNSGDLMDLNVMYSLMNLMHNKTFH